MGSLNLAARAARWSAAHWKTAVAVWVAFVVVAVGLGTTVGTHKLSASEQSTGEIGAGRADPRERGLQDAGGGERARPFLERKPSPTRRSARPCRACS